MGSDLLGDIRREIDARLAHLLPAVEEYERLLAAIDAVGREGPGSVTYHEPAHKRSQGPLGGGARAQRPQGPTEPASVEHANGNGFGLLQPDEASPVPPGSVVVREAILAALEHGSHTVPELAVVTGEGTGAVNRWLRLLARDGEVAKTEREGKLAWSLVS